MVIQPTPPRTPYVHHLGRSAAPPTSIIPPAGGSGGDSGRWTLRPPAGDSGSSLRASTSEDGTASDEAGLHVSMASPFRVTTILIDRPSVVVSKCLRHVLAISGSSRDTISYRIS